MGSMRAKASARFVDKLLTIFGRCGCAIAVAAPGAPRHVVLFGVVRDDLGLDLEQPEIELARINLALTALHQD